MGPWRRSELAHLGSELRWLDGDDALHSYEYALKFSSNTRCGLSESTVERIERHIVESPTVARAWVQNRIPADDFTVRVVCGPDDIFILPTTLFVDSWPDLFTPGRDDAVVLADRADWVFFFCHEEEIEFGWRPRRFDRRAA